MSGETCAAGGRARRSPALRCPGLPARALCLAAPEPQLGEAGFWAVGQGSEGTPAPAPCGRPEPRGAEGYRGRCGRSLALGTWKGFGTFLTFAVPTASPAPFGVPRADALGLPASPRSVLSLLGGDPGRQGSCAVRARVWRTRWGLGTASRRFGTSFASPSPIQPRPPSLGQAQGSGGREAEIVPGWRLRYSGGGAGRGGAGQGRPGGVGSPAGQGREPAAGLRRSRSWNLPGGGGSEVWGVRRLGPGLPRFCSHRGWWWGRVRWGVPGVSCGVE